MHRLQVPVTGTARWLHASTTAMGSTAELVVYGSDPALLDGALHELERREQCWSRFRVDSELCEFNRRTSDTVAVSTTLFEALAAADAAHHDTGGRFDPTVLGALEALGYDRSFESIRAAGDLGPRPTVPPSPFGARVPGFDELRLDAVAGTATLPVGVAVDLGGIGKGLAADAVSRWLADAGASSACVALGGDVAVAGVAPPDGWAVPIEDPARPGSDLGTVRLYGGAIVASTTVQRRWRIGSDMAHHLVDPSTGRSTASGVATAIVRGPDAAHAEAVAKAAVVAGPVDGVALVERLGLSGLLIGDDGSRFDAGLVIDALAAAAS
ncbi:MAG: FAD:protein FMN transferase [Acidimicrobiales bacterium]